MDVFGVVPGRRENFGIELMMDLLESHNARGTFFLNVYEAAKHGDAAIASAARLIHSRGHDLELHTHPRPMYRFYGMSDATLNEQVAVLEKGISLIEQWTGKRVVAHRAGAFCANMDTLRAVKAVKLAADCSLAAGSHVELQLPTQLGATNLPFRVDAVWEIPVTFYRQMSFAPWRSRRHLSIEGSSLAEIKHIVRYAVRHGLPTVCILMHSFSFTRKGRPDQRFIRRMSDLIEWLREQNGVVVSTVDATLPSLDANVASQSTTLVPCTGIWLTWLRVLGSWRDGWKNLLIAVVSVVVLAVLILLVAYAGVIVLGSG